MRKRFLVGCVAVPAALLAAIALWPETPPHPTGAWMERAGVSPRSIQVGDARLRYVRRGDGPAVVLVHGFASSIYTWAEVLPPLAQRHDVVAVDLPGFGGSDVPARFDAQAMAELLARLMDGLGLPRASLVGNSLGGALSAVTAARHPGRVERLVLIDSAGYNLGPADRPLLLRAIGTLPGGLLDIWPQRPLVRFGLVQVFHDDSKVTPERVEEYLAPMARRGARAAVRAVLRGSEAFGLPGVLREVRAPTLVIWGADDAWIPLRDADRFVRDIRGARKVVLERCGHVPQEERPVELARLVGEFLGED
jgi:pimeloyl-ACP methyl ester carboxylesterase